MVLLCNIFCNAFLAYHSMLSNRYFAYSGRLYPITPGYLKKLSNTRRVLIRSVSSISIFLLTSLAIGRTYFSVSFRCRIILLFEAILLCKSVKFPVSFSDTQLLWCFSTSLPPVPSRLPVLNLHLCYGSLVRRFGNIFKEVVDKRGL